MPEELPVPSSDVPVTPEKPKTRIFLSNEDLDAAGITDAAVGDSVTLTIAGRIVSDNESEDSRDKSIEVDSISSSPASTDEAPLPGEDAPESEEPSVAEEVPPVESEDVSEDDEKSDPEEEKALGYKRPKKKGKGFPINTKKLEGGW